MNDVPMSFLDLMLRSQALREQAVTKLKEGDREAAGRLLKKSILLDQALAEVLVQDGVPQK